MLVDANQKIQQIINQIDDIVTQVQTKKIDGSLIQKFNELMNEASSKIQGIISVN